MVKRLFLLSLFVCLVGAVYAEDTAVCDNEPLIDAKAMHYERTPLNKAGRGVINGATFWLEIPAGMFKVSKERNPFLGVTLGLAEGTVTAVFRALTGLADIVTFPIGPYDRPFMDPEYAVESLEENYNDYILFKKY